MVFKIGPCSQKVIHGTALSPYSSKFPFLRVKEPVKEPVNSSWRSFGYPPCDWICLNVCNLLLCISTGWAENPQSTHSRRWSCPLCLSSNTFTLKWPIGLHEWHHGVKIQRMRSSPRTYFRNRGFVVSWWKAHAFRSENLLLVPASDSQLLYGCTAALTDSGERIFR